MAFAERNKDALYAQQVVRDSKRYVAVLLEEVLWRFPRAPARPALEAEVARDWAMSGSQLATDWLVRLVRARLTGGPETLDAAVARLAIPGFQVEPLQIPGARGDAPRWLLRITLDDPDWPTPMSGGVALSVRPLEGGRFEVNEVGGYWLPFHGEIFDLILPQSPDPASPMVVLYQQETLGSGPGWTVAWVCIYRWQESTWTPVIDLRYADGAGPEPCFAMGDWASISLEEPDPSGYPVVAVTRMVDRLACDWEVVHRFTWDGTRYTPTTEFRRFEAGTSWEVAACTSTMLHWAVTLKAGDRQRFLEHLLVLSSNWPAEEAFFLSLDKVRFHLGRLLAFEGDIETARAVLLGPISNPSNPSDTTWSVYARAFLSKLPDVARAEEAYLEAIRTDWLADTGVSTPGDLLETLATRLFHDRQPGDVLAQLVGALPRPDLACLPPDDDACAGLWYLRALAYERTGRPDGALAAFTALMRRYPDTVFALAAARRLVGAMPHPAQ